VVHLFSGKSRAAKGAADAASGDKHATAPHRRRHGSLIGVTYDGGRLDFAHCTFRGEEPPDTVVVTGRYDGDVGAALLGYLERSGLPDAPAVFGVSAFNAIVDQKKFAPRLSQKECISTLRLQADVTAINVVSRDSLAIVMSMKRDRLATYGVVDDKVLSDIEKHAATAGLHLLAVDHAGFAWRRALEAYGSVDGVIELTDDAVLVYVFTKDIFKAKHFQRDSGNAWTSSVGRFLGQLRSSSDGQIDPGHLVLFGDDIDPGLKNELWTECNASISLLEVNNPQTNEPEYGPRWMLAYGLALYESAS